MKKWGIKVRLALSLTGHVVLLLFLAFYLNISLLSIQRHNPLSDSRQQQLESTAKLPPLIHDLQTSLLAALVTPSTEQLKDYEETRAQLQTHLNELSQSAIPLDFFEHNRRQAIQDWIQFADNALKTPHPSPAQFTLLRNESAKILQQVTINNDQARIEATQAIQGLRDEETDETRGRILLMWGLVGLITCATTLIQYFASNSIIQPVQKLSEVLSRFQKGDISARAHLKSGGEIQTLGEIFNGMASSIQRNQDDLYQANAQLEERVAVKTRELEENNLKLKDADRLKDQFFATLSHELRTPLTPILSCAYLLQQSKQLAPEEEKTIQTIERNAHALSRMIDELLNLSAIINQKIFFTKEKTELNAWATSILDNLRPAADKKELKLLFHPHPRPLEAEIDPARLAQVLTNLINNAIKFTPPGGTITTELTADKSKIRLSVTDTGVGLSEEDLPRVFEMFHQASSNLNPVVGGLGIGLTVARSLAELHNGGLMATSAGVGRGATFTLWLPRDQPSLTRIPESKPLPALEKFKGRRLLLVEDSLDTLEALQRIFQRRGCEVWTAQDGVQALALAREKKPDIILSDIGLPHLNGLEMMKQMRQDPDLKQVIAVALSGLGRTEDVEAARNAGFDLHLLKPIEIPLLDRSLIQALEEREKLPKD